MIKKLVDVKTLNCKTRDVETMEEARTMLHSRQHFDCVFLGFNHASEWNEIVEFITWTNGEKHLLAVPFVICNRHELTVEQKIFLDEHALTIHTSRIQDENISVSLESFLGQIDTTAQTRPLMIDHPEGFVNSLKGKTVLITDDDMRNTYSLSAILEEKEMNVIIAGNGKEALEKLNSNPQIEIVLLDIMMPVMDGYETLKQIRSEERWKALPVIALTANALIGTREKCIAFGANEYLSKPVNTEQLMNLLEVWIND